MNNVRKVLFVLFTLSLCFFTLSGCGYKPSVSYAKKELSGKVFVKLFIDLKDPRNAVLIKDAMNQLLVQKLNSKLVYDEALADTIMNIKITSVSMTTLQYDADGYNNLYRAKVNIGVNYNNKEEKITRNFTVSGENDFSLGSSTTITDTKRFDAIKSASDDALDEVLSKIAVASFKK
ncbi:MAG: hypothetical protein CL624_06030 [Arcobacter sp.]|uniref:Penicillin-binding protein activator LpoB n=1 Tax=Poseidonibacter ostreae TaxID=2654171 RepID=A0A6L4WZ28_9BACT|nr:hypothetical protein GA417_08005 [Poseidonibacter ostreae]KAB7891125.1 hypothetical protein GBG19_01140 [Poseidonibacter ostreae]KAB7892849.1 hypothetical protein GBG18_00850 [Poseidonibacter ostreae]MAC83675.1 hypothetical protein [Arcobacter sp.]